ncbi:hypothetical protein VN0630_03010 [Helicobacter pylori]
MIFGKDKNKKKITTILRKVKGSKFKFYICGGENGKDDCVIFTFHFDWKKETQDWYEIVFKDFRDFMLNIETKLKELREKHDAKVKEEEEAKAKEREQEMITQEIKKARAFVNKEAEEGDNDALQFSAKLKDLIREICKRDGVEIEQIEKAIGFLCLAYYYGFRDINGSKVTDNWIFLETCNNTKKHRSVYMQFDFMRDLKCDLMENCKKIIG